MFFMLLHCHGEYPQVPGKSHCAARVGDGDSTLGLEDTGVQVNLPWVPESDRVGTPAQGF